MQVRIFCYKFVITKTNNNIMFATTHRQTVEKVIAYTNDRLHTWYKNANTNYDIVGAGSARVDKDANITITYIENGVVCEYTVAYWEENAIDYVFNVWSEQANVENDAIQR